MTGATGVILAEEVESVLEESNSVETLEAIILDNTPVNTGCEAGLVSVLERKMLKKIHTIGCFLHQNELPFRAVFKYLDGAIRGPSSFTGPIGKLRCKDVHNLPQVDFEPISSSLDNHYSSITKIEDLSNDLRLLLEYALGISRGKFEPRYAAYRIRPLIQSR